MFTDGRAPGDLGFDPLNLSADESALRRYELAELKHSRLAMIAIGGFVHQVRSLYYFIFALTTTTHRQFFSGHHHQDSGS
jgi:hypothetical protein